MALPAPAFEAFARDTTDSTTRSFRLEASQKALAASHSRLAPMSIGGYGTDFEGGQRREPRSMGGSVPVARLGVAVGACLLVVALGASLAVAPARGARPRLAALETEALTVAAGAATTPALGGVDVVAFFALAPGAAPVAGSPEHRYDVVTRDDRGVAYEATFFFSSEAHRAAFADDPGAYLPRFGGFCAFGISSEGNGGGDAGADVAADTDGWPWAREHLGPPTDTANWAVVDGKLYFTFLPEVLAAFLGDYDALGAAGEARWAEWFGPDAGGLPAGPFQVDCMAAGYGPPVTRTCTLAPQRSDVRDYATAPSVLAPDCLAAAFAACGAHQGDNPVSSPPGACSACLAAEFEALRGACPATETAVHAAVDKAFCW